MPFKVNFILKYFDLFDTVVDNIRDDKNYGHIPIFLRILRACCSFMTEVLKIIAGKHVKFEGGLPYSMM